ncbi:hypothetical protein FNF27_00845 [Cafeteria roenbergensis]|uniref:AttH domain-containing protein n=2 Tax=Cafeteria roenbergensis TaxID=33653 RepID=A0A5A8CUA9_CAFRO|nr:hypothetical protein FNF29_01092 [Cafeteria roenbergensis]KAA0165656.1 hypothetical protein FNF28_03406 [Cafeteria roenbergensis]KAA0168405.1 hypothetical protein FNF31_00287 [Cafeteria roenbergensis]KAA0177672.1 hypothetical protein FNF27_00845 [Cafeteria roenbergensis]|eukprot:KAA0156299.1 hypothetical protein FNF29_01092 [Cafeteria roenbergensis]
MAGICSPAQALATDALAGSLRLRDEPGWNRVGPNSAPLRFPVDHLLHEGASDEWHYFVASGMAEPEDGSSGEVPWSAIVLLDFHLPGPVTTAVDAFGPDPTLSVAGPATMARSRVLDVRVSVSVGGSCPGHTAAGAVVYGPAAPVIAGITDQVAGAAGKPAFVVGLGTAATINTTAATASIVADDPVKLNDVTVRTRDVATGTGTTLRATRTTPSILQRGAAGDSIIGQDDTGNGYRYYSVPRYALSGTVDARDCNGTLRRMRVTDGLGWLDHQWGTIALPFTLKQRQEQALYVRLGGKVPIVDRGFGIVGVETWFAFQITDAATGMPAFLKGAVLSGNVVEIGPFASLVNLPVHGRVGFANGTSTVLTGVLNVTGTTQCPLARARAGECDPLKPNSSHAFYWTDVSVDVPDMGINAEAGTRLLASTVAPDHVLSYGSGQPLWEGGAVARCSACDQGAPPSAYVFVEQINWDPNGTRDILAVAGVPDASAALQKAAETEYNFANS